MFVSTLEHFSYFETWGEYKKISEGCAKAYEKEWLNEICMLQNLEGKGFKVNMRDNWNEIKVRDFEEEKVEGLK
jgi:hypothetical protein